LAEILADVAREAGPEAAVDEYRSLREEHDDAGRYDFREQTLSRVSRMYVEAGNPDAALAVLAGAKEFFGGSPSVYFNEALVKFGQQDAEGARASLQQALAVDPDFEPAKQALARLDAMETQAESEPDDGSNE